MPLDLPDSFEEAERFQRLFVKPMVDAVRAEVELQLRPLVKQVDAHNQRLADLEGKQKKALIGWGVYATLAAAGIGVGIDWIKRKLHWI